jgi:hypothetical protein
MVMNRKQHSDKTRTKQGSPAEGPDPYKIAASTPFDFGAKNLTPYGRYARINVAMSALIFTGDLQEVLPGGLAVRGEPGDQCAVCESCKRLVCKVLR